MDLIERQAAIEEIEFGFTYAKVIDIETGQTRELFQQGNDELRKAVERIKRLPSAEPERKIGEWKHNGSQWKNRWLCSKCGYTWFQPKENAKYCPNCGARME